MLLFFFFKQKTAYEMRISDWSSDVCSSDLVDPEQCASRDRFIGQAGTGDDSASTEARQGCGVVTDDLSMCGGLEFPPANLRPSDQELIISIGRANGIERLRWFDVARGKKFHPRPPAGTAQIAT